MMLQSHSCWSSARSSASRLWSASRSPTSRTSWLRLWRRRSSSCSTCTQYLEKGAQSFTNISWTRIWVQYLHCPGWSRGLVTCCPTTGTWYGCTTSSWRNLPWCRSTWPLQSLFIEKRKFWPQVLINIPCKWAWRNNCPKIPKHLILKQSKKSEVLKNSISFYSNKTVCTIR